MSFLAPAAILAALAAAPAPVRLQSLTATSGSDPASLLDGRPDTGWRPEGDAVDEGVLLRFEEPTRVDAVELASCAGAYSVQLFLNGRSQGAPLAPTPQGVAVRLPGRNPIVQSMFVKVTGATRPPCLGELRFLRGGEALPVLPPRRVGGRVAASSTLAPAAAYHPSYLFDARLEFGWVEGSKGTGEGESITVDLDSPVEIAAVEIWNGYQRLTSHFQKNARARGVAISLDDGPAVHHELKDEPGGQKLTLASPARARRVQLRIDSVYRGSKYADLVLSEMRLWGAEGPVGIDVRDREEMRASLVSELKGGAVAGLLGRHLDNGCSGEGDYRRTLKLRADNTFVAYEAASSPDTGTTLEVLDGTWVPIARAGPWTEIEIFGRRLRVDETWDPYGENPRKVRQSERIAGGRLRIAVVGDLPAREREELIGFDPPWGLVGLCVDRAADAVRGAVVVSGPPLSDLFLIHGK